MQTTTMAREVRLERWSGRTFFVVPCPFHVDLPLDMSGCLRASLREVARAGYKRKERGALLASDVRGAGAVFVEIEDPEETDPRVVSLTGELVVRALPGEPCADSSRATHAATRGLRREVDELVHWSRELGQEVASFYVDFTSADDGVFRPARLIAHLDGEMVEHFEVRSSLSYSYVLRPVEEIRVTLDIAV